MTHPVLRKTRLPMNVLHPQITKMFRLIKVSMPMFPKRKPAISCRASSGLDGSLKNLSFFITSILISIMMVEFLAVKLDTGVST